MKRAEKKALKAKLKAMTFQEKREYYKSKRIGWRKAWYILKWIMAGFGAFVVTCLIIMIVQINKPDPVVTKAAPKPQPVQTEHLDYKGFIFGMALHENHYRNKIDMESSLDQEAVAYKPTAAEIAQFTKDIVSSYKNKTYLKADDEGIMTEIFKARVVERYYPDNKNVMADNFAFDYYQVVRDVFRGVAKPGDDFVKANEEQMNKEM